MRTSGQIQRRGALSAAVLAKMRASDNENAPLVGEVEAREERSALSIALWMTIAVCVVIFGIALARSVTGQSAETDLRTALGSMLGSAQGSASATGSHRYILNNAPNLKPRASFPTEEAFRNSASFQTAEMAAKTLPLALYCRNRIAVDTIKSILGTVTGQDPYHAEVLAIRLLSQHREQLGYTNSACSKKLPGRMATLFARI